MGHASFFTPEKIKAALADGTLKQADIDGAVRRLVHVCVEMGYFDHVQERTDLPKDSPASDAVALHVAENALVLLKNDQQLLPLDRTKIKRVAVYGYNAENTPYVGGGSGAVRAFRSVSFLDGIKKAAGDAINVKSLAQSNRTHGDGATLGCAKTKPDGEPGLTLKLPQSDKTQTATAIDLNWTNDKLPFDVPSDSKGSLTWSGTLVSPTDGDWKVVADTVNTYIHVKIGDHEVHTLPMYSFHLAANQAVPVKISVELSSRQKTHKVHITLEPLVLPDLQPAKDADAVVACVGFDGGSEYESYDREFELPLEQQQLLVELTKANPHLIVVLNSGGGVGMEKWIDQTPALVEAWYLGQDGGTALGEMLFGDIDAMGRLPQTFDRDLKDNLSMATWPGVKTADAKFPVATYSDGLYVGYRGYDKTGKDPRFPFGFGLSYTSFKFDHFTATPSGDEVTAALDVTNTGSRAGSDVVQIYVGQPGAKIDRPKRELKGFSKVELKPQETKRVEIKLPKDAFEYWDPAKKDLATDPAPFTIEAAESARDIKASSLVELPKG